MSNSEEHLSADVVAMALFNQITTDSTTPKVVFAVEDITEKDNSLNSYEECTKWDK
jgi:hypothetical protein